MGVALKETIEKDRKFYSNKSLFKVCVNKEGHNENSKDIIQNNGGNINESTLPTEENNITNENMLLEHIHIGESFQNPFSIHEEIFDPSFNIFEFSDQVGRENVLLIISGNIFNQFDLMEKIPVNIFINFINEIKNGYKKENSYHNVSINIDSHLGLTRS
jgi:hypothetical protein